MAKTAQTVDALTAARKATDASREARDLADAVIALVEATNKTATLLIWTLTGRSKVTWAPPE